MSISAIIMMCIACIGLWGGIAVSATIIIKSKKKRPAATDKEAE
ncbi:MAG: methionine/alanine import family NSS transporter small subunit [Eubacteriales bacterium]|nr:methionine/alanine import family NSS transporter small subunit [Eubacteriales bacterium]